MQPEDEDEGDGEDEDEGEEDGDRTMTPTGNMSARHLCRPRERRPILGHPWFIQRAVVAAAAAHPPKVEVETVAGKAVPPRRQEVADLGQGPTVRVEGVIPPSQMGVARGAQAAMGQAPAMGRLTGPAESPDSHVAIVTAVAAAVALPEAPAATTEGVATTTPHFSHNVAAQGFCRRVRYIPHAI